MNWASPGSPYVVCRREGGQLLFEVSEVRMVDVLTDLFHLVRSFAVEISCPEPEEKRKKVRPPYLWVSAGERKKLDEGIRVEGLTFEYVGTDLLCGSEWAFYRDRSVTAISVEKVVEEHLSVSSRSFCFN